MTKHDCFEYHGLDECCEECGESCEESWWEVYADNQYDDMDFDD